MAGTAVEVYGLVAVAARPMRGLQAGAALLVPLGCSAFLAPTIPTFSRQATSDSSATRLHVLTKESVRENVPIPQPTKTAPAEKTFVFLWIDHLGNRIYKTTKGIGPSPRRIQLWNPLVADDQQDYPEAGIYSPPTFTKYEQLDDTAMEDWVERGFGELDDVEESPVAYTVVGDEAAAAGPAIESKEETSAETHTDAELSDEIEQRYQDWETYYPSASFEGMVEALRRSWRAIVLSRGKQGAKAMREFYRDLHRRHSDLEEKIWIMETHATRSPVPGDPDTYNHWMSDEDILKMARVATEGHDDVVEFSGLTIADVGDGVKGEDWVTIPPPLSWFADKK